MSRWLKSLVVMIALLPVLALPPAPVVAQSSDTTSSSDEKHGLDHAPQTREDGWATARPSEAGFDAARLAALTADIRSGKIHNVHAVIIEHGGRLIYERYFAGPDERWGDPIGNVEFNRESLHDLRSVSKSVATALLGIALEGKHREALERPITSYFERLNGAFGPGVETVTLKHVLTMTAGLEWNEMTVPYTSSENDEIRLYYTDDPVALVLSRPVRETAGSSWYYNGGLSQVVAGVVRSITGKPIHKYAEEVLFGPLGITDYEWLGSSRWKPGTSPSAASGLRMRARDLAKIGSVFLHQGMWDGRQIVPADWVELSGQHHVSEIPWGRSTATYGYGFMWYPGITSGDPGHRVLRAAGNGDQRIFVLPELRLAITIFAGNYNVWSHRSDAKILDHVMAAHIQ